MMEKIKVSNYEELSKAAAGLAIDRARRKPDLTLGLATGSTPIGMYKELVKACERGRISFKPVTTFNLDEYCGLPAGHPQSYRRFMDDHLFNETDINKDKTHFPSCAQSDGEYDQIIKEAGGVDIQVLGVGRNGHIGFNEPGSSFDSRTRLVDLADSTIQDNARFFSEAKDVPRQAVTMGLATIMETKEILLLASGQNKREVVSRLLAGGVSEELPVSILWRHPRVTLIYDEDAS